MNNFVLGAPGIYGLCYRWNYREIGGVGPTEFIRMPNIRLVLVYITTPEIIPTGTVVGCATDITVPGVGFDLLPPSQLPITCRWGDNAALGSFEPTFRNDTLITCRTPPFAATGITPFWLGFDELKVLPALETFRVVDLEEMTIDSLFPGGGTYNIPLVVNLRGSNFVNFGGARCNFGPFDGGLAIVDSPWEARCPKLAFPDSVRDMVGGYPLVFSPNGQCFPTAANIAANPQVANAFTTYNALLEGLTVTGSPSDSQIEVGVMGSGFVFLPGALCTYTATSGTTIVQNASVVSSTLAHCNSPRGMVPSVSYRLALLLNGLTTTPDMGSLGGTLDFTEYDIASVRISSIFPIGGPTRETTAITVNGAGFINLGAGQMRCEMRSANSPPISMLATPLGIAFPITSVACPFLAPVTANAGFSLTLSLNNGTADTFSSDLVPFTVYDHAQVYYISPNEGDANGGNQVTIHGSGFLALSLYGPVREENMRCKFGTEVQTRQPSFHNDTAVVCVTTYGSEDPLGQPVSIALNRRSYYSSGGRVRYIFKGLHQPALIEAYFPSNGASVVIRFDNQATNRANMNGIAPCSRIFDDATVTTLQGSSSSMPLCSWQDDMVVEALIDMFTSAGPGMVVGVRPNVMWPKSWAYPGTCDVPESMCAGAISVTIDENFPCDVRDTEEIEACVTPEAVISAPEKISSCPGAPMVLDGSRSYGGGIKPVVYQWSAHPTRSDNYYSIQPSVSSHASPFLLYQLTSADLTDFDRLASRRSNARWEHQTRK